MGGMILIKHEKERKIKSRQAIAFWGDRADVYCRFVSAMLSREKVLVVDLSNSSSLIIGVYGECGENEKENMHAITFTKNVDFFVENMDKYKTVIIFDDFCDKNNSLCNYMKYANYLNEVYMCFNSTRSSMTKLATMYECIGQSPAEAYNYVYDGTGREARIWGVSEYWRYIGEKLKNPQKVYIVPQNEGDFVEFLKLDYGTFQMKSLSVGFKGMLLDILNNSTLGESEKEDVENKALFCL